MNKIKVRALLVFLMIHLGLALAIYGIARISAVNGMDSTLDTLLLGLLLMYVGSVLAACFIILPLLPWIKRAQQATHWTDKLFKDFPVFFENLPKIIEAVKAILAIWNDYKKKSHTTAPTSGSKNPATDTAPSSALSPSGSSHGNP